MREFKVLKDHKVREDHKGLKGPYLVSKVLKDLKVL
jgi:hypothetical protein